MDTEFFLKHIWQAATIAKIKYHLDIVRNQSEIYEIIHQFSNISI